VVGSGCQEALTRLRQRAESWSCPAGGVAGGRGSKPSHSASEGVLVVPLSPPTDPPHCPDGGLVRGMDLGCVKACLS
jgi:hypothetical protein